MKEYLVEGEKFNLGEKVRRKKLGDKVQAKKFKICQFCSNSVGTPLEFAAFRSGFDANIAE